MFGRFGWAEILVIVILVVILFGHAKVPGMMKNLADGINIFKKELKDSAPARSDAPHAAGKRGGAGKKVAVAAKKGTAKKSVKKSTRK